MVPHPRRRLPRRPATTDPNPEIGAAGPTGNGPDDELTDADTDTGPLRRCIVTRESVPKERLIRFVLGPDRMIVPDLLARLPGRGMWLSARGDVLEPGRARDRLVGCFARAARGPVKVPSDLFELLTGGLARRIGELLGLARRAGQAVAGFERSRDWLRAGRAGLVVEAADGSPAEQARFLSGARGMPVVTPLSAAALGAVFGRETAYHVVVAPGRLAETIAADSARLAGLAGPTAAPAAARDTATNTTNATIGRVPDR